MFRSAVLAVVAAIPICSGMPSATAAPFRNLDFEQAVLNPSGEFEGSLPVSRGMPYWTVIEGKYVASGVGYDGVALDYPSVSLHDGLHPGYGGFSPLQGNYSVLLQTGTRSGAMGAGRNYVAISQIGDIPAGALRIQFILDSAGTPGDSFQVLLNGVGVWNGDYISEFAGQTNVELRCEAEGNNRTDFRLDAIEFIVVPEPSAIFHLGIGAVVLLAYALQRRRTRRTGGNNGVRTIFQRQL